MGVDTGQVWQIEDGANVKCAKWGDYRAGEKWRIWDMLTSGKIGDEIVVVYGGNSSQIAKSGISRSVGEYCQKWGFKLRVVYSSRHLVRVRFEGLV